MSSRLAASATRIGRCLDWTVGDWRMPLPALLDLVKEFGTKKKLFWTLVEEFEGTGLRYCFDSGHALVEGDDILAKWRHLAPQVTTLHLHDNFGQKDEHMTPFSGKVPWEELVPAIKESGYRGMLRFECNPGPIDDLQEWLSSASKACRRAADLFS